MARHRVNGYRESAIMSGLPFDFLEIMNSTGGFMQASTFGQRALFLAPALHG